PSRPALTITAFALAGSIRGVLIGQMAYAASLLPNTQLGQRLASGALSGIVYLAIIALMVQSVRDHADSGAQLAREQAHLADATAGSRAELERVSAEIVERVRGQMITRLEVIVYALTEAGSQLADGAKAIAGLIDSTLKPLVDEITSRPEHLRLADPKTAVTAAGDRMALFSDTTMIRPISPEATAVAIALAGSASFIPLAGPARMLAASVLVGFGLTFVLRVFAVPMRWAARMLGPFGRAGVLTLLLELSGLILTALVLLLWSVLGLDLQRQTYISLMAASPIVVVLVGWGIAVTAAWNRRADEIDSELAAAVESLKAQDASLVREVAVERDRLARFVHGPLQDHLIAAWGLLERGDSQLPVDNDLVGAAIQIGQAIQMLEDRIADPQAGTEALPTVSQLVGSYARVWEGLVEIECSVDPTAQSRLADDPLAAGAIGEVIREGIANAARHARSDRVNVLVTSDNPESVRVVVEAEARIDLSTAAEGRPEASARRGLGSSTLNQLTTSWQLEKLDSGSRLTAVISVVPRSVFV
ncbi:MAG: hypothetical protein NTX07_07945, partial [Solirubrobacterales bacterium]|nr:hypothetical protein [Solirubrobacterales bacterium]